MRLYPKVVVKGQSFVDVKKVTVPNQSMSLREIIQRFVRRESLPVSKEGMYDERFGDIEKMAKMDITEQMDIVQDLKNRVANFEKRMAEQEAAAEKERVEKEAVEKHVSQQPKEPPAPEGKPAQKSPL